MSQDLFLYVPGSKVLIRGLPVDLKTVLITAGKSNPYFFNTELYPFA